MVVWGGHSCPPVTSIPLNDSTLFLFAVFFWRFSANDVERIP